MKKDKDFYNKESSFYSSKRYPLVPSNYAQFFFKRRLKYVLKYLVDIFKEKDGLNILEIGCADGIVLRSIFERFGKKLSDIIGIDNAEKMIEEAKLNTKEIKIEFFIRGEEPKKGFDVILELGVINYSDFDNDLEYAKERLKKDGIYILSVAGKGSINSYFGKGDGYNNFLSYKEYEEKIKKIFNIEKIIPCGVYSPFVWRISTVGRFVQNILEKLFFLFPNLYHEKIYILRSKL
jgi:SAM-dependent methyltransferase